ncbi:MAG: cupin domain-containing protein [Candidatus Cloacimonetes bacterium]|nr:cupin domain-containing protein [Candidatus Cloacimonadota bacterium]
MKHVHYSDVPLEQVNMEGARKTMIRWLIAEKDGAPNFAMRMFELEPGGFTPYHAHSWEHENFIVEGKGVLITEDREIPFQPGDVLYVEPQLKHHYKNTGDTVLKFLCLVPLEKTQTTQQTLNPFAAGKANNC